MAKRQRKHIRTSVKGKKFRAGSRVPKAEQKKIMNDFFAKSAADLKKVKKVKLPGLGVLRVHTKRAQKGGKTIMMFGKKVVTKSKPKRRIVKFRASKALRSRL